MNSVAVLIWIALHDLTYVNNNKKGVTLIRYTIQLHLLFDDWLITSIFFFLHSYGGWAVCSQAPHSKLSFLAWNLCISKCPLSIGLMTLGSELLAQILSLLPDFHFISNVPLGLDFELGLILICLHDKQKSWMRLSDLITYFLKAETMGLIHVLRSRGFPKILWDTWHIAYGVPEYRINKTRVCGNVSTEWIFIQGLDEMYLVRS